MPTGTPVRTPEVQGALHNLLEGGNLVETGGKEWENGVSFTQFGCYIVTGDEADYCDPDTESVTPQDCFPAAVFMPYVLEVGIVYSAADRFDIKELSVKTTEIGSSSRLERFIYSGSSAGDTNPTLSDGASLGAAASPRTALGRMMAAFVSAETHTGAQGTVHVSPVVAVHLEGLIKPDDNGQLRTAYGGHKVIIGNYPSTHIAGHIGDIDVYLGEIYVNEAPDEIRRTNDQLFQIQRLALATWNPCAMFTQQIDYALVGGGG